MAASQRRDGQGRPDFAGVEIVALNWDRGQPRDCTPSDIRVRIRRFAGLSTGDARANAEESDSEAHRIGFGPFEQRGPNPQLLHLLRLGEPNLRLFQWPEKAYEPRLLQYWRVLSVTKEAGIYSRPHSRAKRG